MKRWLIASAVMTLLVSAVVFAQSRASPPVVWLGIPGQWVWRYDPSPFIDRALFCLAVAALLGWLCHSVRERVFELAGGRLTAFLLMAVGLVFGLQASFAYLSRSGFGEGVFWMGTPKANADFAEACRTNTVFELLRQAQDPARPFRIHLSTHPPGPVLWYRFQKNIWEEYPQAAARFVAMSEDHLPYAPESRQELETKVLSRPLTDVERATLYGSIFLLWLAVALGVVPLFFWAADLFGSETAVMAVGLYGLIPSLLLFNPMTDQLYVPLALAILAMLHLGVARRDAAQLVVAGALVWVALQFTLAFTVVLFLVGLHLGMAALMERRLWPTAKLLGWSVAAFIALIGLCFFLPAHYDSFLVWRLCADNNASFNTSRSYLAWLGYNPIDFAVFLGLPVTLFLLRGILGTVSRVDRDARWRFTMALGATLILMEVTGMNRGEVARLWMFLMPMAAAMAADAMRGPDPKDRWAFLTAFGLLFLQSVLFKVSLDLLLPSVG